MIRVVSLVLAVAAMGCGGARYRVVAPTSGVPVSTSQALHASDGRVLLVPEDLEVVGHFERRARHWSILWTLIPLGSREVDLSSAFTEEAAQRGGIGIVNLEVAAWFDMFTALLGHVPLVPTYGDVVVSGDVVRLRTPEPQP